MITIAGTVGMPITNITPTIIIITTRIRQDRLTHHIKITVTVLHLQKITILTQAARPLKNRTLLNVRVIDLQ
jgi:hypothetical protein